MALPYYPMNPKDCDTDENFRLLDDAEIGMWLRLLNHSWENDGLPSDPEEIRRAFRYTAEQFAERWPRVSRCFPVYEDGRRRNPRQEKERVKAVAIVERSKKGAGARWKCSSTAQAMPKQSASIDQAIPRASESSGSSGSVVVLEKRNSEAPQNSVEVVDDRDNPLSIIDELVPIYGKAGAPISPAQQELCLRHIMSIEPPERRRKVTQYVKWAIVSGKWRTAAKTKSLYNLLTDGLNDWDIEITPEMLRRIREPTKGEEAQNIAARRFEQRMREEGRV